MKVQRCNRRAVLVLKLLYRHYWSRFDDGIWICKRQGHRRSKTPRNFSCSRSCSKAILTNFKLQWTFYIFFMIWKIPLNILFINNEFEIKTNLYCYIWRTNKFQNINILFRKNFVVSKNWCKIKNILLDHQNSYVGISNMMRK